MTAYSQQEDNCYSSVKRIFIMPMVKRMIMIANTYTLSARLDIL